MFGYEIPIETNLKKYYVIQENYTDDFGTGQVLAPMKGTSGNNRFYVMALDDFDSSNHYWYYSASGGTMSDYYSTTTQSFGSGKTNTTNMIAKWNYSAYGYQTIDGSYSDIWGIVQKKQENNGESKINKGWFVPSSSEFAAFSDAFNVTSSNFYDKYGLSYDYWTSSQAGSDRAYTVYFGLSYISAYLVDSTHFLRLSITF